MLKRRVIALSLILSLRSLPVAAQNGSGDMLSQIRKEAMERSQIMKTMHMFYGRLWATADRFTRPHSAANRD